MLKFPATVTRELALLLTWITILPVPSIVRSPIKVRSPGEFPGFRIPEIVELPFTIPLPRNVPEGPTLMDPIDPLRCPRQYFT